MYLETDKYLPYFNQRDINDHLLYLHSIGHFQNTMDEIGLLI